MNRRNWMLSPLLSATFALSLFVCTTQAALLKDIRIGEYQKFTRIVFELDTSVKPESINLISSDRLTIIFPHTSVDFIRKIPVERSRQIKSIRIMDQSNHLSATINLDFKYLRHESFQLKNPPRVVLDIQPLTEARHPAGSTIIKEHDGNGSELERIEASDSRAASTTQLPQENTIREQDINITSEEGAHNAAETATHVGNEPPISPPTLTNTDQANDNTVTNQTIDNDSTPRAVAGKTNRLQFYLVIILVLITIAILVLLLVMLLSRHRWAVDGTQLKPKEFLENQDKHLASLDARIKEQIKRYEEA